VRPRSPLIALSIAAVTFLCFLPALRAGFLIWDDQAYLVRNAQFLALGWRGLGWMFTNNVMFVYQPLAWLSYALDYSFWGLNPFGFHLTNLLLHCLNSVLFYRLALRLLTGVARPSKNDVLAAGAAALCFSIHPLRVESVAWASERRDVLSGTFFLLTLTAYLNAVESPSNRWRWLTAAWIAYTAALLTKTFAVTLPAVLVLLDFYPLRRLPRERRLWLRHRSVWLEKAPFLLPAAALATVALQTAAPVNLPIGLYGLLPRLSQVAFAPGFYLWKTVMPWGLSPMYKLSRLTHPVLFLSCGLATIATSAAAWRARRDNPWMLAAWLYFLIVLLPLLGWVRTGDAAAADRYTYLAGLSLALVAGASVREGLRRRPAAAGLLAAVLLAALGAATWRQAGFWRDSVSLWSHAVAVDPDSGFAHNNLAVALESAGLGEEARAQRKLGDFSPASEYQDLGEACYKRGDWAGAARFFSWTAEIEPGLPSAQNDWGLALDRLGRNEEAAEHFGFALMLDPGFAPARANLAAARGQSNRAK
jgi:tetratricopeptide (TPR) repeat protein